MNKFWSRRIRELEAYVPGEQPKNRKYIKLNTNENPYPPSPKAEKAMRCAAGEAMRLYPDPECTELLGVIAEQFGLNKNQIFVGNGSDEVLAMCFPAFFDGDEPILFPDVSYSFYRVYAEFNRLHYKTVPLNDDFTLPVEAFAEANGGIVIANPNAPTGIALPLEAIESIAQGSPNSVFIVDEAYVDFGGESALQLIDKYPNLLVVRTCSKSYSLAGLRVGWAMGNPELIAALNTVKNSVNSYTLDRVAIAGGAAAIADAEYFQACCERVCATRERTIEALEKLGFRCLPSSANFVFAAHGKMPAETIFAKLREAGILVRYFKKPRIDNFLRISIGTDEDMEALIAAMKNILL